MKLVRAFVSIAAFCGCLSAAVVEAQSLQLQKLWTYSSNVFGDPVSATEIIDYHPGSNRFFVVNPAQARVDVLDLNGNSIGNLDLNGIGSPNSVAVFSGGVNDGLLAVAVEAPNKTDAGSVRFYSASTLGFLHSVTVGSLPDMVTFTPDGNKVLVANEGEPNHYNAGNTDPLGTVSVIDVSTGPLAASVANVDFTAFIGQEAALNAAGIRIFGPGANAAQDLEPEYIAVSADSTMAYVSLQESNALAVINLTGSPAITELRSFGLKDHSLPGNGLDASDRDGPGNNGAINIANWNIKGMYQPDSIASYEIGGVRYLVTANEGDARDYSGYAEEVRISSGSYTLDAGAFTPTEIANLKNDDGAGRLTVSLASGNPDGDGDFDEIHVFGGRSFSIWNADTGAQVYDSGDFFEQFFANPANGLDAFFNASNDNNSLDNRSDNKGPEPEGLALGEIAGRTYAFVGMERMGGIMVFDITDPNNPFFETYQTDRLFSEEPGLNLGGDLAPEGLRFIPGQPGVFGGANLLAVASEISGTVTLYAVAPVPEPSTWALGSLAAFALLGVAYRQRRKSASQPE